MYKEKIWKETWGFAQWIHFAGLDKHCRQRWNGIHRFPWVPHDDEIESSRSEPGRRYKGGVQSVWQCKYSVQCTGHSRQIQGVDEINDKMINNK